MLHSSLRCVWLEQQEKQLMLLPSPCISNHSQGLKASVLYFLLYSRGHNADKATFSQTMMTPLTLKHSSALSPPNLSLKALALSSSPIIQSFDLNLVSFILLWPLWPGCILVAPRAREWTALPWLMSPLASALLKVIQKLITLENSSSIHLEVLLWGLNELVQIKGNDVKFLVIYWYSSRHQNVFKME